jgi:hypothetical protein
MNRIKIVQAVELDRRLFYHLDFLLLSVWDLEAKCTSNIEIP